MLTIILALCGLILIVLSAVILNANYRNVSNRWLGAFTLSGFLWLAANLFADISSSPHANLIFSRMAIIGASLLPFTYLFFCIRFTKLKLPRLAKYSLALPVIGLLLTTPTKLNVISVTGKNLTINPGVSYVVLLVVLIIYFGLGIGILVQNYKNATGSRRQQLYYILAGTATTLIPGIILSCILPLVGYPEAVSFGPAASIFFVLFTAVAIVKHRLFDVRLVIARAVAYAGSLVVIASLFGVIVFGTAQLLFDVHTTIGMQLFISLATGLAAVLFSGVKKRFDRLTNKLFYADAYDPQNLFDSLNQVLVSSLDLNILLQRVSQLLMLEMKAEFCLIGLKEVSGTPQRLIGSQKREISFSDIMAIRKLTVNYRHSAILTDELDVEKYGELKRILSRYDIAVLVRLTTNVTRNEEGLGYLLFGPKKSGNPYTTQDLRVFDTIANSLIIAIQNALHFEEIQNFNQTLQQKVIDATKQMRRSNEKLKALDETKDDFISMASHQLRTPLTSVKGYLSMVLDGDAGKLNPTERKMLTQAFISSQRMVYLISDLLNVSRLKTGKFIIDAHPINLADIISDEIAQLKETAATRSVELTYHKPADFPALPLDETKTRQVIMNFVDNAIYYTPAGGHITVELLDRPSTIELKVIDDGMGVPKSEQHHLFTKFYRAGNARKARPDGTGLGLFMAKKVVLAQGGALLFDSHEGKGSTFGFTFSKSKLVAAATQATSTIAK